MNVRERILGARLLEKAGRYPEYFRSLKIKTALKEMTGRNENEPTGSHKIGKA